MSDEYYVYLIIDPRTNTVIYVGKGKNNRYLVHENIAKSTTRKVVNKKLINKLRKIIFLGFKPIYKFKKNLSSDEAFKKEQELTTKIGLKNLCNLKHGGTNGATFTKEIKDKMRRAALALDPSHWKDPERCRKISESKLGKPRSEDTKRKMSKALKGKTWVERFGEDRAADIIEKIKSKTVGQKRPKRSLAMKGKLSGKNNPMYGKHHSDEFKQKRREYFILHNPGKNKTEETKKRISASKKGKPGTRHTEEYKKLMSEKMKEIWKQRKAGSKQDERNRDN